MLFLKLDFTDSKINLFLLEIFQLYYLYDYIFIICSYLFIFVIYIHILLYCYTYMIYKLFLVRDHGNN